MRVFVASFVEQQAAGQLAGAVPRVTGMRPVPAENLHLTLHFLGSIDDTKREELIAFVRALEAFPVRVRISEVAGFPSGNRARTLVAMIEIIEGMAVLNRWHDALARAFPTGDSAKTFRPHITLGRSRKGIRVPEIESLAGREIALLAPRVYESRTLSEGARYLPLS